MKAKESANQSGGETPHSKLGHYANAPSRSLPRLALIVWLGIVVVVCIRALVNGRGHSVYPIFADAARHWLAGLDLYGLNAAPYRYSPLVAALLVPFSMIPDPLAGALWRLLNVWVYLSALLWWSRSVLPRPLTAPQLAALFLLVVPLSVGSLNNGQSNPLVLGLILATVAGAARGRWNLAAGCMALACLFKLYPIAVGLLLTGVYGRRFGGRLAVALALGLVLPFLLQQPDYVAGQYVSWFDYLRADNRQGLSPEGWYRDIRLLCHTCHLSIDSKSYLFIQLLAAAAMAGVCFSGRLLLREPRRLLTSLLALGCCWMTLFGSATESNTYILLAPSLAWALLDAWSRPSPRWIRMGLLASFALFLVTQAAVWYPGGGRPFHALGPHPLAAALFFVCQLASDFREFMNNSSIGAKAMLAVRAT